MTNKPNWQSELRDKLLEAADLGGDIYCVKAVDIATAFIQDLLNRKAREIEWLRLAKSEWQYNQALDQAISILKEEEHESL